MKKILLYLCVVLILIANSFAFNVYNSQDKEQTYFSLNEDHVFVRSTSNSSLNISYKILEEPKYKTLIFNKCYDKEYCLDFYISDLVENSQGSIISSDYFELKQQDSTKKIYLDLEPPKLEVTNININSEKKQVTLTYNFSDDSNQISKIDFYEKKDSNLNFIKEVSKQTSITYDIDEARTYTFIFKIYDIAGNYKEVEETLEVSDIFAPKIDKALIIKNNNNYKIEFKISDNNLTKYEIIQNSLSLSENIDEKKSYEKTINIPFTSGEIILKAIDGQGNEATKELSLKSPISHTYRNKFSSSKTFSFKSNADMCYLQTVNSEKYNEEMDEKSGEYRIKLDVYSIKEYTVKYYCEKSDYREYFESAFYYDTNKPTEPKISSEQLPNGYVKIKWTESEDRESDVNYALYRDGEKIYDGSKQNFEDNEVIYPNSYQYHIEAYDKAGNKETSQKTTVSPKKVKVAFETTLQDNLRVQNEQLALSFITDKNSDIAVNVKNNNQIIDSKEVLNSPTQKQSFNLMLSPGANQIEINIDDNLGNELKKTYFVTYSQPIQQTSQNEITAEPAQIKQEENTTNSTQPVSGEMEKPKNSWIWFVIILLIFAYFLWYFVFNEDRRRKGLSIIPQKRTVSKKKLKKPPIVNFSLTKDKRLEKDFNRIKKERIARQEERKRDEIRTKRLAAKQTKTTQLHKEKLEDLKNRREINIPLNTREKAKTTHKKIHKETKFEEDLKPTKKQSEKKKPFWARKNEPHKDDELSRYINKVKSAPSWSNPRDYVFQELKPEPLPEKHKEVPKKEEHHQQRENKQEEPKQKPQSAKLDLDSYLSKRKKSRKLFLTERFVDKDIISRNKDR